MSHLIYQALTNVSDDLVDEAIATKLRRKIHWVRYGTMAACLAIVIAVGGQLPGYVDDMFSGVDSSSLSTSTTTTTTTESTVEDAVDTTTGVVHTADQVETMTVTLVSWQEDGFCATVETGNDLFPDGAELTVIYDGAEAWEAGTTVTVSFTDYQDYVEANGFDNRVYATTITTN